MNYYMGLSLTAGSAYDSGLAVIDENNQIILLDKFYKMNDIIFFFENYSSLKYSKMCVSLPWDKTMLEGKWRILSKPYQMVSNNTNMPNRENWTQRYSNRGSDFLRELSQNIEINRFELYLSRQSMHLNSCYKECSPADCKFLQQTLNIEWGFNELPSNLIPMSQLEAIVGAILAKEQAHNPDNIKKLFKFKDLDVIDMIDYKKSVVYS